jgi:hypothetical protein
MPKMSSVTTVIIAVMSLVWLVKAGDPSTVTSKTDSVSSKTQRKAVVVEDFESYTSDEQLAKAWYRPPHGGGTRQTRDSAIKNSGKFSLKVEYSTTLSADKFYSPICRVSMFNPGYSCSIIGGFDAEHTIDHVRFENFRVGGKLVTCPDAMDLYCKQTNDIAFR